MSFPSDSKNDAAPRSGVFVRRLSALDAHAFRNMRLAMLREEPLAFRVAQEDEAALSEEAYAQRLEKDYVIGAFQADRLIGLAGFSGFAGAKLRHKGLLWGMYVRPEARGGEAANLLMSQIILHARESVEILVLTVVANNSRAIRFYQRWGFSEYGHEPASIKVRHDEYLDEKLMSVIFKDA